MTCTACERRRQGYHYGVTRFDFAFSRPLSWPLALIGVTPWTAHVDVTDDEFSVRFGPWSLVTPLSNVEGASVTGPYLPFKVLGPHVSLTDRGVTFGTSWSRGVCVRFRRPVSAALPAGLLHHPAVTVTVADADALVALLERRPAGTPGAGDELRRVLASVPAAAEPQAAATPDAGTAPPTPVSRRPLKRTTSRSTSLTSTVPPEAPAAPTEASATDAPAPSPAPTAARTPARKRTPKPKAVPEHPTPADMPKHTPTEKVPGVTPPADEDLPGPDEPRG